MNIRQFGRLLAIGGAVLFPFAVEAQETATVAGRIVETSTGRPISEVVVLVVGTTTGTRTNEAGVYRLVNVPAGPVQLRAARIGFRASTRAVTVSAGVNDNVDFTLDQAATVLDAVVTNAVTGQVERRRENGANVGTIAVAEITKGPITKFTDVLTGRTAGVTVQGTSGTTGTSQRIRIRGANSLSLSNEPLVYVDGSLVSNSITISSGVGGQAVSRLNDIAPEDIENIEVLKGPAATAMYGTAAANGVLLITTKRGTAGNTRWNTYGELGRQTDKTDYPANYLAYSALTPNAPLLDANGGFDFTARAPCFNFQEAAGTCVADSVAVFNTLTDKRTTPFTDGDLTKLGANVAGGSEQVRYYLGLDNQSEHGVVSYNTLNKLGFRANLNASLLKTLDFALSSQYTRSRVALNSNDNSIFSPLINGLVGSPFFFAPGANGKTSVNNFRGFTPENLNDSVAHQDVDRFTLGGVSNYRPLSWLSANLNVGLDYINRFDFRTLQPNRLPIAQSFTIGNRESLHGANFLYTGNASTSAKFEVTPDFRTNSTVGASYNRNLLETTSGFGAGIVEGTGSLGATSSLFSVAEDFFEVISVGAFARQEVSWKDRIFLAGSVRIDDNSAFGTDFGRIYYPGVNLSWVVAEEPWFPQTDYVSSLRVRGAYGRSGQRPDFRDATTFFNPVAVTIGGAEQSAVTLQRTGNLDLRPEKTDEVEFGADFGFFKERVSLQLTHFNKRSRDALISRRLAPSLGLTATVLQNLGGLRNRGTEAQLDVRAFDSENVQLNFRATATQLRNRIEEIGKGVTDIVINRGNQRHRVGYSAGAFFQRPIFINDANRDGLLARSEVTVGDTNVYIGDAIPRWNRALSADVRLFRVVRVGTLFEGRGGNKQLNFSEQFRCTQGVSFGERGCSATGNPDASLKEQAAFIASRFGGSAPSRPGTTQAGYIEDGSFVKWRELSLTLEAPQDWSYLRMGRLQGASVTFAGRNLKTWTDYSGIDPEIVEAATTAFNQSEFNTQPAPRFYTLRFNLNF